MKLNIRNEINAKKRSKKNSGQFLESVLDGKNKKVILNGKNSGKEASAGKKVVKISTFKRKNSNLKNNEFDAEDLKTVVLKDAKRVILKKH